MNKNKNSDLSFQVAFIKCVLGLILYNVLAWILSFWLSESIAQTLSFLTIILLGYFYLPALKKIGFLRWASIVILFVGCFGGLQYGKTHFGESRLWAGIAFGATGVLSFFLNWLYLWVMSNGEKVESKDDLMTPGTWLIWNGIGGLAMILLGVFIALGFLG